MKRFGTFTFPLGLAWARLRHRPGRAFLLVLGIAAAAAAFAVVLGGSLVAQDVSAGRALDALPAADRAVAVNYADLGLKRNGVTRRDLEPLVTRTLSRLGDGNPIRAVQFKLLRIGGELTNLAALDDLPRWVRLTSGRYPRQCTQARCEVVQVGGSGEIGSAPGVRLVKVGVGELTSPLPFGHLPGAAATRVGESFGVEEPPFVVAGSFDDLSGLPGLFSLYRTYSWTAPLSAADVHPWEIDDFRADATRAASTLRSRSLFLSLSAPNEALSAARSTGELAGRRLLLVGGQVAALLLAFALLAAVGMRRDVDAARQRLTWFGGRRWQIALVTVGETAACALAGVVLGWTLGSGATAILAGRAGSPAGAVLAHSALAGRGIVAAVVIALAAFAVLVLALSIPPLSLGGRTFTPLDAAALGALVAVLLALARGDVNAGSLQGGGGTGTFLLLLPGLVTFVIAVAAGRLLVPGLRALERLTRGRRLDLRLASLSLARSPGRSTVAISFLVASLGLGIFAAVYRSTLDAGIAAQAAYAVPKDFTLREDLSPTGLVSPLQAAPLASYRALGAEVTPVIRRAASAGTNRNLTVLGVPAGDVRGLDGWQDRFSPLSRGDLVERISPEKAPELRGAELPADANELRVPYGLEGGAVAVTAVVLERAGLFNRIDLGTAGEAEGTLRAEIPDAARGGRVVALELSRPLSVEGHSDFARLDGVLTLATLEAGDRVLTDFAGWKGEDGVEGTGTRLRFLLTNDAADPRFQPLQATDAQPPAVVATPNLAAAAGDGGLLPLRVPGGQVLVRVVGAIRRFPSVSGDFVLGDEGSLFVALNAANPGTANADELWLSGPPSLDDRLERPPYARLAVASRAALERRLRADPLARGSLAALTAAAVVAFFLALLGLAVLLIGDASDERRELFDLETQGAGPSMLRRHLRLRAVLVAALGLIGGLIAAVILSALAVDLVALTAGAGLPEPPLTLAVDWPLVGLACLAYAAAAGALVGFSARRAI